jgi:DNA modification methylase
MAKDGTNCGGARIGAGQKKKPLADKILEGNPGRRKLMVMEFTDAAELEGESMPPPRDYLAAKQKNGKTTLAVEIYEKTWQWLKERRCVHLIPAQLIEQYAQSVARWIQCEECITEFGFLAKHPTIDELLNRWYSKEAIQDSFDIDKAHEEIVQREPVTKRGDIWLLGNHRLMCGDSTKDEDFNKLMDGCHAQMAVTSPPYGVGKEYEKAEIEPWFETVRPVIRNLCRYADIVCWNLGDLYATGSQFIEPTSVYSVNMFLDNGYRPIWIRIWKKQGQNFGVGPYHLVSNKPVQQYEYISAFSNKGEVEEYNDQEYVWLSAFAGHSYKFVKRLTKEERKKWGYAGIWEMTTVRANKEHPAMFPVELSWRCIKMHSDKGGIALEPFSGSGTTIIAAEQTERKCYAMELSPVYCDLAVKRWEEFTGEKAIKLEG